MYIYIYIHKAALSLKHVFMCNTTITKINVNLHTFGLSFCVKFYRIFMILYSKIWNIVNPDFYQIIIFFLQVKLQLDTP